MGAKGLKCRRHFFEKKIEIMEYKVQVYQVEGKENLLGFANLVLEGQFVLTGKMREVDINPRMNRSLLAEIRLRFQDGAIMVNQAAIYRNWNGESFVSMLHRTRKDIKEIQNICFPIISEFLAGLKECIM